MKARKFEEFKNSKEYILWENLKTVCDTLQLKEQNDFLKIEDLNEYWEPFLERLFKIGVFFKHTGKLKEIKVDWLRPVFYIKTEYDIKMDGKVYKNVNPGAIGNGHNLANELRYLIDPIQSFDKLNIDNYAQLKKDLQKACKNFFVSLIRFSQKEGYWDLLHNIKVILRPLLDLRKANYHLFMMELRENYDVDLTLFNDKKDLGEFMKRIANYFKEQEYRLSRNVPDMEEFKIYLSENMGQGSFEYIFAGNQRKENLDLLEANKFRKEALQKNFEEGFEKMLKYLYEKKKDDFPFTVDVRKLFLTLELFEADQVECIKFYINNQKSILRSLKIKLYESKINGLSRVKMPITKNVEIIDNIKKLYDMHNIIDYIFGDKLGYDSFVFIYNCLKFLENSSMKDEFVIVKNKIFMEDCIPKYVILSAMKHSAEILERMRLKSKSQDKYLNWDDYFQVTQMKLDYEDTSMINAFQINDSNRKLIQTNPEILKIRENLHNEKKEFGRFWMLERFFSPEDRKLWLEGIELLRNINPLVIEDIRDYILHNIEDSSKQVQNGEEPKLTDLNSSGITSNTGTRGDFKRGQSQQKLSSIKQKSIKNIKDLRRKSTSKGSNKHQKKTIIDNNYDSEDESASNQRKNIQFKLDSFRPPKVWNFPIEKIKRREEEKRVEIRNVDPKDFYKDKRVVRFLNILNEVKIKMMNYSAIVKKEIWENYFEKILLIMGLNYTFSSKKILDTQSISMTEEI